MPLPDTQTPAGTHSELQQFSQQLTCKAWCLLCARPKIGISLGPNEQMPCLLSNRCGDRGLLSKDFGEFDIRLKGMWWCLGKPVSGVPEIPGQPSQDWRRASH